MMKQIKEADIANISQNQIQAEILRRDFYEFVKFFWPVVETAELKDGWYLKALARHLHHATDFQNLAINCPPGHSKSILSQILWPCWMFANDKTMRILCCTNSQALSVDFALRCRRLLESEEYRTLYPEVMITKDMKAKEKFGIVGGGSRQCTSVGSQVLGMRAEAIVGDDLNSAQNNTKEEREKCWNFFRTVLSTRMNTTKRKSTIVVIQQRLHNDDISGKIKEADILGDWTFLILPYEHDLERNNHTTLSGFNDKWGKFWTDPRTRPGEILSRVMTKEQAGRTKRQMTSAMWEAMYNQNPKHGDGEIFKLADFRYWTEDQTDYYLTDGEITRKYSKSSCWYFLTADLAVGEKTSQDYTVLSTFCVTPGCELLMIDMGRSKTKSGDIVPFMMGYNSKYHLSYIVIESVGFQMSVVQDARSAGLPVRPYHPHQDKVARSYALQVRCENHEFYLPRHKEWTSIVEQELIDFGPNCTRDDIVDTCSMAGIQVLRQRPNYSAEIQLPPEVQKQKEEDEFQKRYTEALYIDLI